MNPAQAEQKGKSSSAMKLDIKNTTQSTDSSISMTFDSTPDCGYKSGEITSQPVSSNQSGASASSSDQIKLEQSLYDSGLVSDCFSPSSEILDISKLAIQDDSHKKQEDVKEKYSLKDIFTQDKDGDTILHLAVVEAGSDIIFPLINLVSHPDLLDIYNNLYQTLLHLAALTGKCHVVRKLVVAGATLNMQDHNGNTALHIAARRGDLDCVEAILNPISELEIQNAGSPYHLFIQKEDLTYFIDMKNYDGMSCVHLAAEGGFLKVMESLYNHSANIDIQDGKTGRTALHYAVQNKNQKLVELLIQCEADAYIRDYAGRAAINIAKSQCKRHPTKRNQDILALLETVFLFTYDSSEEESEYSSDEVDFEELVRFRQSINSSNTV